MPWSLNSAGFVIGEKNLPFIKAINIPRNKPKIIDMAILRIVGLTWAHYMHYLLLWYCPLYCLNNWVAQLLFNSSAYSLVIFQDLGIDQCIFVVSLAMILFDSHQSSFVF